MDVLKSLGKSFSFVSLTHFQTRTLGIIVFRIVKFLIILGKMQVHFNNDSKISIPSFLKSL
jgi:coenzyme F420-reducing hydrogenase beta subunit